MGPCNADLPDTRRQTTAAGLWQSTIFWTGGWDLLTSATLQTAEVSLPLPLSRPPLMLPLRVLTLPMLLLLLLVMLVVVPLLLVPVLVSVVLEAVWTQYNPGARWDAVDKRSTSGVVDGTP